MTTSLTRARHRAARRPIIQIISNAAGDNLATVGRRSAVVAASSGLLVSLLAAPASAAPAAPALGSADASSLTGAARAQLSAAPAITVANGDWAVSVKPVKVTPAPAPVVAPVAQVPVAASRTAVRVTPAPAPAPVAAPVADPTPAPAAKPETKPEAKPEAKPKNKPEAKPADKAENKPEAKPAASSSKIVDIALRYVGVPYVYGGTTPNGFDCSGFTSHVFAQVGVNLPRTSGAQRGSGSVVSRANAKPGDLIWSPGHIAIYLGGNKQIDAPRPGKSVQVRTIWQSNPTFLRVG